MSPQDPQGQTSWEDIARNKRCERDKKIPPKLRVSAGRLPPPRQLFVEHWPRDSGLLSTEDLLITESTASDIVNRIAAGELTSEQVTVAVCKRAAVVQQVLNCLTEILFEDAIARAKQLDSYFKTNGKVVGPLHGLPVSLKDQFNLKGLDSTIGYISRVGNPATHDSTLVKLLHSAGAVFYVKTNVPTTLMMGETNNFLFGQTLHPRNRELTPGGSSGGESALISSRASFLGVGTDIGGSIRNPCAWTGLYGLRPSIGRVSCKGLANSLAGQEAIRSCAGPMCRNPSDVRLFMTAVAGTQPWLHDPDMLPIPWRTEAENLPRKLCFGFGWHDGHVQPTPPLRRAMEVTKSKLVAAGHTVIDFIPTENAEAAKIGFTMWSADGGKDVQAATATTGEPLPPGIEAWMGKSSGLKPIETSRMWKIQKRRTELAGEWVERWNRTVEETGTGRPIDGLIMPTAPFPALRHGQPFVWNYCILAALLDLTSGVFPVTKVDPEKDVVPESWKPMSRKDKEVRELYDKPGNYANALVGLALIGRRLEEEKVTAMLQLLHDIVGPDYEYGDDWTELKEDSVGHERL